MTIERLLSELISIQSVSGSEKIIQERIGEYLERFGFNVKLENTLPGRPNLYAMRGDSKILIATHCDTTPAWEHPNAFSPAVRGKLIHGRGAIDAKGQIASLIKAVEECDYPCDIAIFVDEEREGKGSKLFSPSKSYSGAIVLEPTNLKIAPGEAGGIGLEIEIAGIPAHGATPWAGKNAIEKAFDLYGKIREIALSQKRDPRYPPPWINLGRIEGGEDSYLVPAMCTMALDIAVLPGNKALDLLQRIEPLLKGTKYRVTELDDPIEISEEQFPVPQLKEATKAAGIEPALSYFTSWSDAHNLSAKGMPCAIFGAGKLELAHTPYEHANLEELETLKEILKQFLKINAL
ncbi:MAG: M20/M25/M40 family metallo-hydrolase [Synergistetes bacterium]|nr:M20/M25/M40 family metallo-hydrolase [Synergistota bacterium]